MLWFLFAGLTAFAVLAAIWPLRALSERNNDSGLSKAAFYKAQLTKSA